MNYGVVSESSDSSRISTRERAGRKIDHRANVPGRWVYVETGDPELDTDDSPVWMNGFDFEEGYPVAFRHGLDGQTDMIGMYDLVTGAPVSGDVAFEMPLRWAQNLPPAHQFPLELATDVWTTATQVCAIVGGVGEIRIFWPLVATAYP